MSEQKTAWTHPLMAGLPVTGDEIEALSHQMINKAMNREIGDAGISDPMFPIIRRMVHAAGDLSLAETIRIHPEAVTAARQVFKNGLPIICDVRMLKAGITRTANEVTCMIRDEEVKQLALSIGCTRSSASMRSLGEKLNNTIVAVGNAPTAIWTLLELADTRGIRPALVVGTPVGFVGAAESKQALMESGLCYISNVGPRGGSPIAAAAVNALALMAEKD